MKSFSKASFALVAAVMALFAGIAYFVARNTSDLMVQEARRRVHGVVKATVGQIDQLMSGVETATANSAWLVREHRGDPDFMYRITQELVRNNLYIVGSSVAFRPGFCKDASRHYFAPYTCQETDGSLRSFPLGKYGDGQWYDHQGWYARAVDSKGGVWSEPYFDEGGAKILMSTFSLPVRAEDGRTFAVFTADLSLSQLTERVSALHPFPRAYAELYTSIGATIVAPPERKEIRPGEATIKVMETAKNGWTVVITCPVENIVSEANRLAGRIIGFSLLGLLLIFALASAFSVRLERSVAQQNRMEGELVTARAIQRNVLPQLFPPHVCGFLRPAREVGGDLYDFVERDGGLYFIVGDASGKGVPASLFSFMAVTVFRMAAGMDLAPAEILARINAALVRGNEMCMFVTAFVGRLDRRTGRLDYGSAGHNAPVVVASDGTAAFLPVKRNIPLGVMEGKAYLDESAEIPVGAKIVAYTDGVTEAEQADHAQFGNGRLLAALAVGDCAVRDVTDRLLAAVDAFADGAEQADDITILTVGR